MPRSKTAIRALPTDQITDLTDTRLKIIQDAAQLSTNPFLQEVAELALGILMIIQDGNDSTDRFKYLADDVCTIVHIITHNSQEQTALLSKDLDSLKDLLELILVSIEHFLKREISQPFFFRLLRQRWSTRKIQKYQENLRTSLDIFESQQSIQGNVGRASLRREDIVPTLQEPLPNKREGHSMSHNDCETSIKVESGVMDGNTGSPHHEAVQQNQPLKGTTAANAETKRRDLEHDRRQQAKYERIEGQKVEEAELIKREYQNKIIQQEQEKAERLERTRKIEHDRLALQRMEYERREKGGSGEVKKADVVEGVSQITSQNSSGRERAEAERMERRRKIEHDWLALQRMEDERREKERDDKAKKRTDIADEEAQEAQNVLHEIEWGAEPSYTPPSKITYSSKNPFHHFQQSVSPIIHHHNTGERHDTEPAPRRSNDEEQVINPQRPSFPSQIIHSSRGSFTIVGGDYIVIDNSQSSRNTNTGNTKLITTTESHNSKNNVIDGAVGERVEQSQASSP
ncbi:hypothetical protein BDZ94DRAFT_1313155 [Collybia nuda]|uniref:Uncharacterized protein n=1 Tax=Collybia nuda TaxID=64659 RepID=A0A9P5XZM2_9AGAR|nr:hypothetical protein BDZ94DRAFT_1313155 [Collybia nuda]